MTTPAPPRLASGTAWVEPKTGRPSGPFAKLVDALVRRTEGVTAAELATAPVLLSSASSLTPNGRVLTAGSNIAFDSTTPGQLRISASGGGGGSPTGPLQLIDFTSVSGKSFRDRSGNGNGVAVFGSSAGTFQADGIHFTGADTYVDMGRCLLGSYPFSIAVRFKTSQVAIGGTYPTSPTLYALEAYGYGYDVGITVENGYITFWAGAFRLSSDVYLQSTTYVSDGNWHTALLAWDCVTAALYLDGSLTSAVFTSAADDFTYLGSPSSPQQTPLAGKANATASSRFVGTIKNIAAWGHGLTAAEVAAFAW